MKKDSSKHRKKAKVWGTEFYSIPCSASFCILHQDNLKNRMNKSLSLIIPDAIHPILQIVLHNILCSQRGKELNKFCPQTAATTFAFSSVFILLLCWGYRREPQLIRFVRIVAEKYHGIKIPPYSAIPCCIIGSNPDILASNA